MAKRKLEIIIGVKDNASGKFKKLSTEVEGLDASFKSFARGAIERAGQKLTDFVSRLPGMAVDLVKLGAESETVSNRFVKFAGSADRAQEFLAAFSEATEDTIPRLDAMNAASRLLQMELVANADEMELMAAIAVRLGNQTLTAGQRISDFALLLGNKSVRRLDNFGLSVDSVRARAAELKAEGIGLNEAFKLAVLEQGAANLAILGDTSELASTKIAATAAAFDDLKTAGGEALLEIAADVNLFGLALSNLPERVRGLPDTVSQVLMLRQAFQDASLQFATSAERVDTFNDSVRRQIVLLDTTNPEIDRYATTVKKASDEQSAAAAAAAQLNDHMALIAATAGNTSVPALNGYEQALEEVRETENALALAAAAAKEAMDAQAAAAVQAEQFNLSMGINLMTTFQEMRQNAVDFASSREEIETTHQEKIAALQAEGNAILIAEENARYATELAGLQASRAAQEEAQRLSLGKMVLQNFESWAQMKGITAEQMLEMRTAIAKEYGLIDESTAQTVSTLVAGWEAWADGTDVSTAQAIENMQTAVNAATTMDTDTTASTTTMQKSWETWAKDLDVSMQTTEDNEADLGTKTDTVTEEMRKSWSAWETETADNAKAVDLALKLTGNNESDFSRQTSREASRMNKTWDGWGGNTTDNTDDVVAAIEGTQNTERIFDARTSSFAKEMNRTWDGWEDNTTSKTKRVGLALKATENNENDLRRNTQRATNQMIADMTGFAAGTREAMGASAQSMDRAKGRASSLANAIDGIPTSRTVTIRINVTGDDIPSFQHGTRSAPGGLALVGERGPELVTLSKGARVFTAGQARSIMSGARSPAPAAPAGPQLSIGELHIHGVQDADGVLRALQNLSITRGNRR